MRLICVILFCLISNTQVQCQGREFEKIDFVKASHNLSDILTENKSNELRSVGSIYCKTFLIFRKKIGSSSSIIIYKDTLILSIAKTKKYFDNSKIINETYSFHNNALSKYTRLVETGTDSVQVGKIYKQNMTDGDVVYKSLMSFHGESESEIKHRFEKIQDNIADDLRRYIDFIKILGIAY